MLEDIGLERQLHAEEAVEERVHLHFRFGVHHADFLQSGQSLRRELFVIVVVVLFDELGCHGEALAVALDGS